MSTLCNPRSQMSTAVWRSQMIAALRIWLVATVAAAAPQPKGTVTWPRGPKLRCAWDAATHALRVSWPRAVAPDPAALAADVYEINIAAASLGRALAVHTTGDLEAELGLDVLLPETTYYLSLRAHAGWAFGSGRLMGADTWGMLGPETACDTGAAPDVAPRGAARDVAPRAPSDGRSTFNIESWRISEYSGATDYLLNHDGADLAGSSLLVTVFAQIEFYKGELALRSTWTGGSTADMVVSVYCVDALPPPTRANDTTDDPRFADYASCNNQPDPSMSRCACAVPMDRLWGRLPISRPRCFKYPGFGACDGSTINCTCACDETETNRSATYTGVLDVFAHDDAEPVGRWYSHPAAAACPEKRTPGDGCTWSMGANTARVVRGSQLYELGLNASALTCDLGDLPDGQVGPSCAPAASQIAQNAAVMRRALAAAPLAPWTCG